LCQLQKLLGALGCAAGLAMTGAAAPPPDYLKIFDAVWRTTDENFYDPAFHGVDWSVARARYRPQVAAVHNDAAFEALIDRMLAELKVSHAYIVAPSQSSARQPGVGADFLTMDAAPVVREVAPLSDARRQGLRIGDRLIGPLAAVNGPKGTAATLQVEGCDGRGRTLSVRRESRSFPRTAPGWSWSSLSPAAGVSLGYLRTDRFDDGDAALADRAMAALKDTNGLIIDLRANSGGNTSALRLASYFTPAGEAPAIALFARPYLKALGREPNAGDVARGPKVVGVYTDEAVFKAVNDHQGQAVFYTEDLGARRYAKPVVVLIGEDTGSAGEGFAWAMRLAGSARFVGRRTAGALLSGESFDVSEGWRLTIPVQGLWGPQGQDFADKAISPDVPIRWTRAEVCQGRDPDLEAAIGMLSSGRS
jgi:carboxyl-terminal processing protease